MHKVITPVQLLVWKVITAFFFFKQYTKSGQHELLVYNFLNFYKNDKQAALFPPNSVLHYNTERKSLSLLWYSKNRHFLIDPQVKLFFHHILSLTIIFLPRVTKRKIYLQMVLKRFSICPLQSAQGSILSSYVAVFECGFQ